MSHVRVCMYVCTSRLYTIVLRISIRMNLMESSLKHGKYVCMYICMYVYIDIGIGVSEE